MTEDADDPTDVPGILLGPDPTTIFDWEVDELDEAAEALDVVRFSLAGIPFAVDGAFVREIVSETALTSIPGTPPHIRGITLLKREVLGVIDLASWLGLPPHTPSDTPRLLVLESDDLTAAFVADSVDGIESWPEAIDPSNVPSNVDPRLRAFALSSRWAPGGIVILLDVETILSEAAVQ